jgi:signal recognition particle GTPase
MAKKLKSGKGFDLEDFKAQMQQMKKMGGMSNLLEKCLASLVRWPRAFRVQKPKNPCVASKASSTR